MSRASQLLYMPGHHAEGEAEADLLGTCEDGIPVGWMLCFGGRNFWEPDDKVVDRGGTSATRDRFTTPLEVADARLLNAIEVLKASEHLWVWFAALELLRRRLVAKGRRGFVHLDAPWALRKDAVRERLTRVTAYAENYVNYVAADREGQVHQYAAAIEEFCPFVPHCTEEDAKRFRKVRSHAGLDEAERAAALIAGMPRDPEHFRAAVANHYAPVFARIGELPPYPQPVAAPAITPLPIKDKESAGLLARLRQKLRRS